MRIYLLVFFIIALIQTALLPINLCLLLLISKSFASYEKENFYLALLGGIILGLFSTVNLGFWPLIFLIVVWLTHLIRKLPLTTNFLTILPTALILIILVTLIESLILKQKINSPIIIWQTLLTLPIFILIKIWEERFVPKNEIKLKIKS